MVLGRYPIIASPQNNTSPPNIKNPERVSILGGVFISIQPRSPAPGATQSITNLPEAYLRTEKVVQIRMKLGRSVG